MLRRESCHNRGEGIIFSKSRVRWFISLRLATVLGGVRLPMPMSMRIRDTEGVAKVQNKEGHTQGRPGGETGREPRAPARWGGGWHRHPTTSNPPTKLLMTTILGHLFKTTPPRYPSSSSIQPICIPRPPWRGEILSALRSQPKQTATRQLHAVCVGFPGWGSYWNIRRGHENGSEIDSVLTRGAREKPHTFGVSEDTNRTPREGGGCLF